MLFSSLLFVPLFHRDRENYKEDIEAVGKHFLMRWNADNDDPYKYHKLRNAFKKAECEGSFESGDHPMTNCAHCWEMCQLLI